MQMHISDADFDLRNNAFKYRVCGLDARGVFHTEPIDLALAVAILNRMHVEAAGEVWLQQDFGEVH